MKASSFFILILLCANILTTSILKAETIKPLSWQTGFHITQAEKPGEWYPATVPGAVQVDYAKAKNLEKTNMWAETGRITAGWKMYSGLTGPLSRNGAFR